MGHGRLRQPASAAAGDADTARRLATGASTALISAGLIAIQTHALANHIDPVLKQMREQAGVLHQQLPGLDLRYKQTGHQRQLEFAKLVIDQAAKLGLGNITGRITGGVGEQVLNGVHGLWEMANCHQPSKFGTAACSDILTGAARLAIAVAEKDTAKLAAALFHKEEWEKDPLKAAGMVGFDLATLLLPFPKGTAALGKGLTTAGNKTGTTLADRATATGKTIGDTIKALTDQLASLAISDTSLIALLKNAGVVNTTRLAIALDTRLATTVNALGAETLGKLATTAGTTELTALLNKLTPTTLANHITTIGVENIGKYLSVHGADRLAATITSTPANKLTTTIADAVKAAAPATVRPQLGAYHTILDKELATAGWTRAKHYDLLTQTGDRIAATSTEQFKTWKHIRDAITINKDTKMVKIINEDQKRMYLGEGDVPKNFNLGVIRGFVARYDDLTGVTTPAQFREALALNPGPKAKWTSPIPDTGEYAYQLRFQTGELHKVNIPYGGHTPESATMLNKHGITRPIDNDAPFTGNGYTAGGIPEWKAVDAILEDGAEIWRINADGQPTLLATYKNGGWQPNPKR